MQARRALLFTPGSDVHMLQKTATLDVDSICLDLEDSVISSRKEEAREYVVRALRELEFKAGERLVRINRVDSGLAEADLEAVLRARPDGIVLPKTATAVSVQFVNRKMNEAEEDNGWPLNSMALLAQIETPRAIIHLKEICESTKRLQALIFGAEDMALGLGATRTSEAWEVFYARSAVVTHAAAFGLQALDMVYTRFEDVEGLRKEAQQGVQLGFSGKQIIHPAQIEPVQAAFTPDDASVANARKVLQTYELEEGAGRGAYAMNGKMVDLPVVMAARNVLARAEAAGRK